jgi:hypothetical protein
MGRREEILGFHKGKIHITDILIKRYEHLLSARLEYVNGPGPLPMVAQLLDAKIKELKGAIAEVMEAQFPEDTANKLFSPLPDSLARGDTDEHVL